MSGTANNKKLHLGPPAASYPDDGALVGTDAIFSSPNVIPPPNAPATMSSTLSSLATGDDGIPAPSIYYDERGEIHNVRVGGAGSDETNPHQRRINILYTKAGYLRSGDLHPNVQCDFVFSGLVKVWTLDAGIGNGSTIVTTYCKHDFIKIPRGVPHVFEFVEDTVMAEWWEDPQGFAAYFYRPYRNIVDESFNDARRRSDDGKSGLVVLRPASDLGGEFVERRGGAFMVGAAAAAAITGAVAFALGARYGRNQSK